MDTYSKTLNKLIANKIIVNFVFEKITPLNLQLLRQMLSCKAMLQIMNTGAM
ncbi:hypothetical protein MKC73_17185 [[Clostridium] innocuum]|nr:hypothetical protein [[Clostridium] innocuum]MCR0265628.1 hypothetical protein [[Clostridium] innocuum]